MIKNKFCLFTVTSGHTQMNLLKHSLLLVSSFAKSRPGIMHVLSSIPINNRMNEQDF